jgi:ADP-ribose pyrophosphatase
MENQNLMTINTVPPTVKSDRPYAGKRISVRRDWVDCGHDGLVLREIIEHPGAVIILPLTIDKKIVLVSQYRHPLDTVLFECPAGTRELNENPLETAKRELAEEAKLSAKVWIDFGYLHPLPGLSNEIQIIFIAKDLQDCDMPTDPGEFLEIHSFDVDEVKRMINDGKITDTKTISAIFKADLNGHFGG